MSHATIISICPAVIDARIPHTQPPRIVIPPGSIDDPQLCIISDGQTSQYIGKGANEKDPWVRYHVPAIDIAKSVVNDYKVSATYVEPGAYPGVFAVSGKPDGVEVGVFGIVYVNNKDFVTKFPVEFQKAKDEQYKWFKIQVQIADRSFAKNSNYAEISNLQRYASKILNLERPWNKEIKPEDFKKCPYCQSFVEPAAIVCVHCTNIVDVEGYKKLKALENEVAKPSGNIFNKGA